MYPITTYYNFERLPGETTKQYSHRCWFINKQKPTTETEFIQAVKWSIIDLVTRFFLDTDSTGVPSK